MEFFQSFAFHLQFYLRVLLEDLRIPLTKHLRDPLVRDTSGAGPCGVGRAQIVNTEARNLGAPQRGRPSGFQSC